MGGYHGGRNHMYWVRFRCFSWFIFPGDIYIHGSHSADHCHPLRKLIHLNCWQHRVVESCRLPTTMCRMPHVNHKPPTLNPEF